MTSKGLITKLLFLISFFLVGSLQAATVEMASQNYAANELMGSVQVRVFVDRSDGNNATILAQFSTTDITAINGTDYTAPVVGVNDTLIFSPTETSKFITISLNRNPLSTGTLQFRVNLDSVVSSDPVNNPVNTGLRTSSIVSIFDLDQVGVQEVAVVATEFRVLEGAGAIVIGFTKSGKNACTVQSIFSDVTATSGSDYTNPGTVTVNFPAAGTPPKPSDVYQEITIPINNLDTTPEPTEYFKIQLTNPTNAELGSFQTSYVSIYDDDILNTVTLEKSSYVVNEGAGSITIKVNVLNRVTNSTITVNYETRSGSALQGADFTYTSGTLTFGPGENTKTFDIPIVDDQIIEPDETILVLLSNLTGNATFGATTQATVTIQDNDVPPLVSFAASNYSASEGNNASIIFNRTGSTTSAFTFTYNLTDSTAVAGTNYVLPGGVSSGTITFNPGDTTFTLPITTINDNLGGSDKTFTITISNPSDGAQISGSSTATVTILETQQSVQFATSTSSVSESVGTYQLAVSASRLNNSAGSFTVDYKMNTGTASTSDFTPSSGTLTFGPNVFSVNIPIPITNDTIREGPENFTVTLSNPSSGVILGTISTATVTILDDESPLQINMLSGDVYVSEGVGTMIVQASLNRPAGDTQTYSASVSTADITAQAGSDYTPILAGDSSSKLTFTPGQDTVSISVPIIDDITAEATETFAVSLIGAGPGATLGKQLQTIVHIQDNDTITGTRFVNLSTRAKVGTGNDVMIGGLVISGNQPKKVLIQARGPSLDSVLPASRLLQNPILQVFSGSTLVAQNDDWGTLPADQLGVVSQVGTLRPSESAVVLTLSPGSYTAVVSGVASTTGIAIVEVYDLAKGSDSELTNLSTRGLTDSSDNQMIMGFVIEGTGTKYAAIRGMGPSLRNYGVSNSITDPKVAFYYGGSTTPIITNDDWKSSAYVSDISASFPPDNPNEAVVVTTDSTTVSSDGILQPLFAGSYTTIVSGVLKSGSGAIVGSQSGVCLGEVYKINK